MKTANEKLRQWARENGDQQDTLIALAILDELQAIRRELGSVGQAVDDLSEQITLIGTGG